MFLFSTCSEWLMTVSLGVKQLKHESDQCTVSNIKLCFHFLICLHGLIMKVMLSLNLKLKMSVLHAVVVFFIW
jgi:hypothetical protein